MQTTAVALFIVCANCGEWAWNGTYAFNGFVILDEFFEKPSVVCFCCIREKMYADNTWFDASWWVDASRFKIDMNLICKN